MKINLLKTAEIYAVLLLTVGMMGCQPHSSSVATLAQTDRVVQIEAKTVPIKGAAKVVCEIEGCVRFDLQTVDSNIDWINQYFIERIQHTEPVAFTKFTQKNPKKLMSRIIWISALSRWNLSISVLIWRLLP